MKNIEDVLKNHAPSHLFPFFWQKGQSDEVIKEYISKMYEQDIRNFCVESRPHPEFLEKGWWHTMDVILSEAEKRSMHLWILDDDKFPTGHANGKVPESLKRRYLAYHCFNLQSNGKEVEIDISKPAGMRALMSDQRHRQDRILACIAVKKDTSVPHHVFAGSELDLTEKNHDGILTVKLPAGAWSIFILYVTLCSEGRGVEDYLDPMRPEAVDILLQEVYQKHYEHYTERFGSTICGFFSDEPSFGNSNSRKEIIGSSDMPLPWNTEVEEQWKQNGLQISDLIYLFSGEDKHASLCRFQYMDIITGLYQRNFTDRIGDWCRDHHVIYVGHVIEDDNVHARLGAGPGHYFRAIDGQDMAGVDIIGGQVVPGMDYHHDSFSSGGSDGEFYHYALVRMGASAAKLDPKKQGRLMCEAFGAYGWAEGLKTMKWITDHMISHGVNWIVPHAFDPADFPDFDCPPHFYAHGMNPQYPYFHVWSNYADRLCHIFSNGVKQAQVGVLYHAFAEWSGNTMMFQKPCKVLQQHQIDTDIINEDYLMKAVIKNNTFEINGCCYRSLVIPSCDTLPEHLVECINQIAEIVPVYAIEEAPTELHVKKVSLEDLPSLLSEQTEIHTSKYLPYLVAYQYQCQGENAWMLTNESVSETLDGEITIAGNTPMMIYDAFANTTYHLQAEYSDQTTFNLHLAPYESLVIVPGHSNQIQVQRGVLLHEITDGFTISMQNYDSMLATTVKQTKVGSLSSVYPHFSGKITYSFSFSLDDSNAVLYIPEVYETVQLILNGRDCGTKIAPEYLFDISTSAVEGINHAELIVVNNLGRSQRDGFSMYLPIEQLGVVSPVQIYQKH